MSSRHRTKYCGFCGKAEDKNWAYHWKTKHPGIVPFEEGQDNPNKLDCEEKKRGEESLGGV